MSERVLVPFDGSPLSVRVLERAVMMHSDSEITVLHVIDPVKAVYEAESKGLPAAENWHGRMIERARGLCADAEARAAEYACDVRTPIETGSPAREILRYVPEHGIDRIIMGSHGRSGVARLIFGSVAEHIVRQSPVPVTIVRWASVANGEFDLVLCLPPNQETKPGNGVRYEFRK